MQLTKEQTEALNALVEYYNREEAGYVSLFKEVHNVFDELVILDLAFKTDGGYFPSTKGQEYLRNI